MQPLAIAVLAGLTPSEWEISFYDDRIEEIDYEKGTDLVGISIETFTAKRGYEIARNYRKMGVPVICGGYHATLMPEETLAQCDSVCIGGAEQVWQEVLKDSSLGRLKPVYRGHPDASLSGIRPDRRVFDTKNYFSIALVETGRGCPFSCNFCSISAFHSATYRRRPTEEIVREIQELNEKTIFFVDDNLIGNRDSAVSLFDALKGLGMKWVGQASIDSCRDRDLLKLMSESGCAGLLIGFESLESGNLLKMNKRINKVEFYGEVLKNLRMNGISVYGTFLFGYPFDSGSLIKKTLDFSTEQKFHLAAFNHITPFPGTPLYESLEKEKRLRYDKWWLSDEYMYGQVPFNPPNMTAFELEEHCRAARKSFYSLRRTIRRGWDFQANCSGIKRTAIFLAVNYLLHTEVTMKTKIPLGFRSDYPGSTN